MRRSEGRGGKFGGRRRVNSVIRYRAEGFGHKDAAFNFASFCRVSIVSYCLWAVVYGGIGSATRKNGAQHCACWVQPNLGLGAPFCRLSGSIKES